MSFRPGCHRPFHRSYRLRSLPLLSQDCVLSSFGSVFFASAIPRHCASACPHFNRRHSPTLRPVFIQLARTVFVEGAGFEPAMFLFTVALRSVLSTTHQSFPIFCALRFCRKGHCSLISLSFPSLMSLLILCFG